MWQYAALKLTEHCTTVRQPYSIVAAAHQHEALAGILAGFTMTSAAFILGRSRSAASELSENSDGQPADGKKVEVPSQALAIFGVGVLILGLDAYIYAMIAGIVPPVDSEHNVLTESEYSCALAWTQAMSADCMLAVGACFMIAGLSWILVWHIGYHDVRSKAVAFVPGTITGITILTTSLMLVRNAALYAKVMTNFGIEISTLWRPILWGIYGVFALWTTVIVGFRTTGILLHMADIDHHLKTLISLRRNPVAWATLGGTFVAIIGPAFATLMTDTEILRDSNTGLPTRFGAALAMLVCVFPAYTVSSALALSTPGLGSKAVWTEITERRRQRRNRGWRDSGSTIHRKASGANRSDNAFTR